ncbi:M48 family metallopeptidase [Erythrobacter sp. SDW2]|uniref:M48 family metallopeptidase n=1 Tax=Erythrobacter sp. SDW2 TaxID=2907154 RepID=UPI001F345C7B|nr:SprT family zinc-dependent metalloprotease [Erythrobacter sp. SDW2]UIP06709.1 M48 family metallopeptidase [Erythrobacter sp. SDW2]
MIDWLRRNPADLTVSVGDATLPVEIRRHPTARRMVLRLADDGASVRVTLPRWGRTVDAVEFAASRTDWLASQLAGRPRTCAPQAGGTLPYRGRHLRIAWERAHPRKPRVEQGHVLLGGPEETLGARLKRWLQAEAREALSDDLAWYAGRANLPAPPLSLSNARRRWGSCSVTGHMRINWRLIMAPDHVRRSVAAHETAHRLHFDHSPAFHAALGKLFEGDLKAADRWLKDHGRSLYAPFG